MLAWTESNRQGLKAEVNLVAAHEHKGHLTLFLRRIKQVTTLFCPLSRALAHSFLTFHTSVF